MWLCDYPQPDSWVYLETLEVPEIEPTHDAPRVKKRRNLKIEQVIENLHLSDADALFKIDQQRRIIDEAAESKPAERRFSSQC